MDFIINSLFEANKYFNDQEPWNKKNDQKRLGAIIFTSLEVIRKICILLYPIMPETSIKALKIFNLNENDIVLSSILNHDYLKQGTKIKKIKILFKKIEKNND